MALKVLYRLKKKPTKETGLKQLYMVTPTKWDQKGRYFTADQLIKILREYFNTLPGTETFPPDWEVVEYQLVETRGSNLDYFVKHKAKQPFIKGLD